MTEDPTDRARALGAGLDRDAGASARADDNKRQAQALVATLLEDEVAMLAHMVGGWSRAESAAELGFEIHQFEKRRAALLAKLNAGSTTDAIRLGIYAGLD